MPIKRLFSSMEISASGLTANRRWMDAIAENLANAQTTRTPEGGPYRRKVAAFAEVARQVRRAQRTPHREMPLTVTQSDHLSLPSGAQQVSRTLGKAAGPAVGVEVSITPETGQPRLVYDPDHPDANDAGYVAYPDVEVVKEMVDLITASRSYEANVTALNAAKAMNRKALEI